MLFYYVRHGDPDYANDSLTQLGKRQAEALAKRLSAHGLDEIYVSSSGRAIETARPTFEILKIEPKVLDWASENYTFKEFTVDIEGKKEWVFDSSAHIDLLVSEKVRKADEGWYDTQELAEYDFKQGIERINKEADAFFETLGYKHNRSKHIYFTEKPNNKRIALFAHYGFGQAFLSSILDIPLPMFAPHFFIAHSSVTVIDFRDLGINLLLPTELYIE